jgi:chromate transporter
VSHWPYADVAMEGIAATAIGLLLTVALRGVRRASRSVAGTLALVATFIGVVCD